MIATILGSLREYKKPSWISILFAMGEVACEVLIAFLMARLLDQGISAGSSSNILKYGVILLTLSLIAMLVGSLSGVSIAKASSGLAGNLRKDAFHRIQNFSFINIDKFSTSSIITRLTTDVSNVQMSFFMIMRVGIRTITMIVLAVVMVFRINTKLAMIYLVLAPVLGLALGIIIRHVYPIFSRVFEKYDKLNEIVQENLRGIRVIKSFVREDDEAEKFEKISSDIFDDFVIAEKFASLNFPFLFLAIYTAILILAWFGTKFIVIDGTMTTGDLFSMISFTMQILINVLMLSGVMVMIAISRNSAERIAELLREESSIVNGDNPVMEVKDGSVKFENVSFSYSGNPKELVLFDIDAEIGTGETIGIIGATGSSKTSMVQLIPRLYDTTIGNILVGGINVKDYDIKTLRDQVAVVLQKNTLFSGTISENLRWGNENATEEELIQACKQAQAHEFISEMEKGYESLVEQGGTNFSGGQKQRLCIARALLKKPKILILDDSTSAVDTKTDKLIRTAMHKEIPDTTQIIIAQRISSVEHADKIIIMENGRMEDIGTHDELLVRNERYKGLYDSQVKGGGTIEE